MTIIKILFQLNNIFFKKTILYLFKLCISIYICTTFFNIIKLSRAKASKYILIISLTTVFGSLYIRQQLSLK